MMRIRMRIHMSRGMSVGGERICKKYRHEIRRMDGWHIAGNKLASMTGVQLSRYPNFIFTQPAFNLTLSYIVYNRVVITNSP